METKEAVQAIPISEAFDAVGECVIIRRIDEAEEKTAGGIIKPEISRQKSNRGEIVCIGEGRVIEGKWMPLPWVIGDIVHFSRYVAGMEIEYDGKLYLKLHWKQIHATEKKRLA